MLQHEMQTTQRNPLQQTPRVYHERQQCRKILHSAQNQLFNKRIRQVNFTIETIKVKISQLQEEL